MDDNVIEHLIPMFPQLTPEVIKFSVLHESNRYQPVDEAHLLQRCIDDLLDLRTYSSFEDLREGPPDILVTDVQSPRTALGHYPQDAILISDSPLCEYSHTLSPRPSSAGGTSSDHRLTVDVSPPPVVTDTPAWYQELALVKKPVVPQGSTQNRERNQNTSVNYDADLPDIGSPIPRRHTSVFSSSVTHSAPLSAYLPSAVIHNASSSSTLHAPATTIQYAPASTYHIPVGTTHNALTTTYHTPAVATHNASLSEAVMHDASMSTSRERTIGILLGASQCLSATDDLSASTSTDGQKHKSATNVTIPSASTSEKTIPLASVSMAGTNTVPLASACMAGTKTVPLASVSMAGTKTEPLASVSMAGTKTEPLASVSMAGTKTVPLASGSMAGTKAEPLASVSMAGTKTVPSASASMAGTKTVPSTSTGMAGSKIEPLASTSMAGTKTAPAASAGMAGTKTAPSASAGMAGTKTAPSASAGMAGTKTAPSASAGMAGTKTAPSASANMASAVSAKTVPSASTSTVGATSAKTVPQATAEMLSAVPSTSQAQPKSHEEKLEEQTQEVCCVFTDADRNYVKDLLRHSFYPDPVNAVCNYMLEENSYLRVKKSEPFLLPAPSLPPISPPQSTVTRQPEGDYYNDNRSVSGIYRNNCIKQLQYDFRKIASKSIHRVASHFGYHYAPTRRALAEAQQRFTPGIRETTLELADFSGEVAMFHVVRLKGKRYGYPVDFSGCPELQDEVAYVKLEGSTEQKQTPTKPGGVSVSEDLFQDIDATIECGCCYDDCCFENMVQCSDGHLFCRKCVENYTRESVFGQGKANLVCMTDSCDAIFPKSQLEVALPADLLSQFESRMQEEAINLAAMTDLVRCPNCDFAAILDPGDKVFRCVECHKETCRYCQENWAEHIGIPCKELEKKDETKIRLAFEEKMTEAKIRACHRCKARFTKLDGCNKMTCRCGARMCYICRKPDIDYNHFCQHVRDPGKGCKKCHSCSLWTNPDEDEERAIVELKKEAQLARMEQGYTEDKMIGTNLSPPKKKRRVDH